MSEEVRNDAVTDVQWTAFMGEDIKNGNEFSDIDFAAFQEIYNKYDGQKQELPNGAIAFYYKDPTMEIYLPVYFITRDRNLVQFGVVKKPYTLDPQGESFTDIHKESGDAEAVINPVEVPRDYWSISGEIITLVPSQAKERLAEGTLFESQKAYQEWYDREGRIQVYFNINGEPVEERIGKAKERLEKHEIFNTPEEAAEYKASQNPDVPPVVEQVVLNGKLIKNPEVIDAFKIKDLITSLNGVEPERFFNNEADVYTDLTITDKNYFKVVAVNTDGFIKYGATATQGRLNLRDIDNTFKMLAERVLYSNDNNAVVDVPPLDNKESEKGE